MSDAALDFVPLDGRKQISLFPEPAENSPYLALGPAELKQQLPELWQTVATEFAQQQVRWGVRPLGESGRLIWGELPGPVAGVVAEVHCNALLLVKRDGWPWLQETGALARAFAESPLGPPVLLPAISEEHARDAGPDLVAVPRSLTQAERALLERVAGGSWQIPLRAGLAQILGDLGYCHELVQSIEGQGRPRHGDYWHAILHRREPDYSNAKYWFRQLGPHPVAAALAPLAAGVLSQCAAAEAGTWSARLQRSGWDSAAFVDLCRDCGSTQNTPLGQAAREIQWLEMLLLLKLCAE